jgi:hypothetical protein
VLAWQQLLILYVRKIQWFCQQGEGFCMHVCSSKLKKRDHVGLFQQVGTGFIGENRRYIIGEAISTIVDFLTLAKTSLLNMFLNLVCYPPIRHCRIIKTIYNKVNLHCYVSFSIFINVITRVWSCKEVNMNRSCSENTRKVGNASV